MPHAMIGADDVLFCFIWCSATRMHVCDDAVVCVTPLYVEATVGMACMICEVATLDTLISTAKTFVYLLNRELAQTITGNSHSHFKTHQQ